MAMNKTCVIVGAVPLGKERAQLETLLKSDSVYKIAADGGIKAFLEAGVLPDHWLGDMDSAAELGLLEGVETEVTDMSEYSTRVAVDRATAERRQKAAVGEDLSTYKAKATNFETAVNGHQTSIGCIAISSEGALTKAQSVVNVGAFVETEVTETQSAVNAGSAAETGVTKPQLAANTSSFTETSVTDTEPASPNSRPLTIRDVLKTIVPVVKDDTDMALGLNKAFEAGCDEVFIFGGMGGSRTSHSFANVQLMHKFAAAGKKITMFTESGKMSVLHNTSIEYPESAKGFISVISLSDVSEDVAIEGFFYEYHGKMTNQNPLGVSNEFAGRSAKVSVGKGTLLIVEENQ